MLIEYQKTRNSVVKKVAAPSRSDPLGAEVKKLTEEIPHLIDVPVASKYGSDMSDRTFTIALANRVEEFKEQLNEDFEINVLPHHVQVIGAAN